MGARGPDPGRRRAWHHWPPGAVGLLLASGSLLFLHLARRACPDRRLALVVGLSYGLRAIVAIAFFLTSANALPILSGLQLGDGFWKFGPDTLDTVGKIATLVTKLRQGVP